MQHDREYWRQHMLAHRRSRLTQTAYCLQNGPHTKTYRTWSRKLEAAGAVEPVRAPADEAKAMEGVEELASPLLPAFPGTRTGQIELISTVAQRHLYTMEERQQHVLAALQSGLPIECYARMAGLTPSALHRWKHKYVVHVGALPAAPAAGPVPMFASVTVAGVADKVPPAGDPAPLGPIAAAWNSIDITLGNGRRLTVDVRVDGPALRRLLAVLEPSA